MRLEVERLARPQGADVGFLDEVLGRRGVARQPARDPVEQVQLLQRELLELFGRRFQWMTRMRTCGLTATPLHVFQPFPRDARRQRYPRPARQVHKYPGFGTLKLTGHGTESMMARREHP